jgi:DNA-binding NtrC family response regulator
MDTILLIDDEERILTGLRLLLKREFTVITTTDPETAFETLRHNKVSVIISDQRMPTIEGVEVLRRARQISPSTTRLLLTGYADLQAVIGAVNDGEVYRYLHKPWENDALLEIVRDAAQISARIGDAATAVAPELVSIDQPTKSDSTVEPHRLLVFDSDTETLKLVQSLQAAKWINCELISCKSVTDLLESLSSVKVSAVLMDYSVVDSGVDRLLRLIKSQAPQVQVLLASRHLDVSLITRLVNEARPYRFLSKPLNRQTQTLRVYVNSAFAKYDSIHARQSLLSLEKAQVHAHVIESDISFFGTLSARLSSFFRATTAMRIPRARE